MATRRRISFQQSMHDYRAANRPGASGYVVNGAFNLAAIMRKAITVARSLRAGGATWQWRMKVALRTVWGWARAEMNPALVPAYAGARR